MKYLRPDDASKKPSVGVVLPVLVIVLWVYGEARYTRHTEPTRTVDAGKSMTSSSCFYSSISSNGFALSPVGTVPVLLFFLVTGAFYKIPGTGKSFIGKPFSRVLAARGPPF